MTRTEIETELNRLRSAAPTSLPWFAERRRGRIAELEAALALAPVPTPAPDARVEKALRAAGGGDRFGRR
jgi:hypothetical protein